MREIKAIIFDFDGVLVDSISVWEEINRVTFRKLNLPVEEAKGFEREVCGMNVEVVAEYYIQKYGVNYSAKEIQNLIMGIANQSFEKFVKPKKNAIELLKFLSNQKIKMAIASSNERDTIRICLKANGLDGYFEEIVTSAEVDRHKPFPDVYLKTAEKLGVNPKECLVFEDTLNGVTAGKNAGMTVYGIYDKFSECLMDQIKNKCDKYFMDFDEVLEYMSCERGIL